MVVKNSIQHPKFVTQFILIFFIFSCQKNCIRLFPQLLHHDLIDRTLKIRDLFVLKVLSRKRKQAEFIDTNVYFFGMFRLLFFFLVLLSLLVLLNERRSSICQISLHSFLLSCYRLEIGSSRSLFKISCQWQLIQ